MTEREFETIWQQAEAESYSKRLAAEYPEWRLKRRRTISIVAALLLVVTVVVSLHTTHLRPTQDYEKVYCNRAGTNDVQWVSLAAEMLME
jgi:ferric-dicitrate binding protein FerR (iron transport regulator)